MKKFIMICIMAYSMVTIEGGEVRVFDACYPTEVFGEYEPTEDEMYLSLYSEEDRMIVASAHYKYQIPVKYLYRLHYIESKQDQNAIRYENNGSVSIGYSQLNDSNIHYFERFNDGLPVNLYDKRQNIMIGAAYLRYLYDRLGNWQGAFISYNCGIGRYLHGNEPEMSFEYSLAILYGPEIINEIKIIKSAVFGIL